MAPPRGSAAYKKKDGTLTVSRNGQSVSWTPVAPPRSEPVLTLAVSDITSESKLFHFSRTYFEPDMLHRPSTDTGDQPKGDAQDLCSSPWYIYFRDPYLHVHITHDREGRGGLDQRCSQQDHPDHQVWRSATCCARRSRGVLCSYGYRKCSVFNP